MATSTTLVAVLAIIPLWPLVSLLLIKLALRALGWLLRHRTRDRRDVITTRTYQEQLAWKRLQETSQEAEDGWEKIEKAGTAENGKPFQDDWAGIVGFFHPFW